MRALPLLGGLALLVGGCNLAPKHERPDVVEADLNWPSYGADTAAATQTAGTRQAADVGWRDFFSDPNIQFLIERSLQNNRDLRIAALNVQAAQAQYRVRRSELAPRVDANAAAEYERFPASGGGHSQSETYTVGLGVTAWELDLWGRLRNLGDEALQNYLALEETRGSIEISLIAEVANAYLTWLADLETIRITEDTLRSQKETYDIQKRSLDGGVGTEVDLTQAQSSVHQAEVNLAQAKRLLAEDWNRLILLVGEPLDDATRSRLAGSQAALQFPGYLPDVPAGLPSDLLLRRPDIRAAERYLMAARARIGAARAAFFPTITLTGAVGTTSDGLSGLFSSGTDFWRFTPQLRLPLFDGGNNQANLDLANVRQHIEVATYERAVQTAFREVADALAGRANLVRELEAQTQLVAATQRTFDLYTLRYEQGIDSYFNALIWQRLLYTAQRDLVTIQLRQLSNRATLYKTLGGGWRERTIAELRSE